MTGFRTPRTPRPTSFSPPTHFSYAVALLSVGLALLITRWLLPWLYPTTTPLFFVAVMISTWYGGLRVGLVATVLSMLAIGYFFTEPFESLQITGLEMLLRLASFLTAAGIISSLTQSRRWALQKAQENLQAVQAAMDREQAAKYQLEIVLASINDGFYVLDHDWQFIYVNDRYCEMVEIPRADLLGQNIWQLFPAAVDTAAYDQFHRALREQTPTQFDYCYTPWNCWHNHRIYPSASGLSVFLADITERKLGELMLVEQKRLLELIATGQPLDDCLTALCESVTRLSPPVRACFLLVGQTDGQRQPRCRSIAPHLPASLAAGLQTLSISDDCNPCSEAVRQGKSIACADLAQAQTCSPAWRELCLAHGILACYASPVRGVNPLPLGSLLLCWNEARLPTSWEDQLVEFASQMASLVFERDRSLRALQQSEKRFQLAARAAAGMIYDWDVPTGQVYRSEGIAGLIGVEAAAAIPNDGWWAERIHPEDRAAIADHWQGLQVVSPGQAPQSYSYEYRIRHAQGHWVDVWDRGYLVRNWAGQVVRVVGSVTDITQRKRIEADLQQSNARFYTAMRAVEGIVFEWNLVTQTVYRSEGLFQLIGVRAEAAPPTARWWTDRVYPEDLQRIQQSFTTVQASMIDRYQDEYRVRHEAGHWVHVWEQGYLQRNAQGEIVGVVGFTTDISQRKQAEAALRHSEERFRMLADAMPQQVWITNAEGKTQYVNQRWLEFTGLTLDQTQDIEAVAHILHPDDFDSAMGLWQTALAMGMPYQSEIRLKHQAGATYRWFLSRAIPIRNEQNEVVQWFGTSTDIEDFKRAEAALRQSECSLQQQTEQLRQANRIKDEFLAVLSHELRSPLNPILGWSKLLQTGKLDEVKTAQALATIERNAKLQSELIEDLLDVSRILQGKLSLNVAPVNLAATIRAAIETVRLAAEAKSITIKTDLIDGEQQVLGDPTRLQQVVWNLLSNAVKFTPAGGQVEVRLERGEAGQAWGSGEAGKRQGESIQVPETASPLNQFCDAAPPEVSPLISSLPHPLTPCACITVRDNGKGIDPAFLPYVFDYFRQEDGTTTRKFGGLGLGLAIVRHLVELHGGTVQVESPGEGQGASFTVRLPLLLSAAVSSPFAAAPPSLNLQGVRVLITDDDPDSRELIAVVLEQNGAIVTTAASAKSALTALLQAPPDILISDIGMPDMDGYMLIRQIRALPTHRGGQVPAIALTAYAGEFDQQKALAYGFQSHLPKPVDAEVLIQTVARWVAPR